jgi:DMSO reductase anchor subunit
MVDRESSNPSSTSAAATSCFADSCGASLILLGQVLSAMHLGKPLRSLALGC